MDKTEIEKCKLTNSEYKEIMLNLAFNKSGDIGEGSRVLKYIKSLEQTITNLKEALTPSGETKGYHIGEYSFNIETTVYDEDEEENVEYMRKVDIPWTSVKDIMKGIVKYSGVKLNDEN